MPDFNIEWFLGQRGVRNVFLDEVEWSHLYLRRGILVVFDTDWNSIQLDDSLHLANFEAKEKRSGAFTRLIQRIEQTSPGLPIFVENLTNSGFASKLPEMGFEEVYTHTRDMQGLVGNWCFLKRYHHA
jgi:hypothetical protein